MLSHVRNAFKESVALLENTVIHRYRMGKHFQQFRATNINIIVRNFFHTAYH